MKLVRNMITAGLTLAVVASTGATVLAKDVAPSTPIAVTNGSCEAFATNTPDEGLYYPLTNDKYPGMVVADISLANGIVLRGLCLDPGWSYTRQSVTGGVQLRFSYNGLKAIDFKFVSGKTDIRAY